MSGSAPEDVDPPAEGRRPSAGAPIAEARRLTVVERVLLLHAAMRSRDRAASLRRVERAFAQAGREGDALLASIIRTLLASGEIETLMFMRAEWLGRHPATRRRVRGEG